MEEFLRFAYASSWYVTVPVALCAITYKIGWYKHTLYAYPLARTLLQQGMASKHPYRTIFFIVRVFLLAVLMMLIAKPQWVDSRSQITVEGIDIVLVLDVSGSMSTPHHEDDERRRIDVAKEEAIRFIQKRDNDAIGLVIFANDALSRCPLTVDKDILKNIIEETDLNLLDPRGTVLSRAMITAANRLRHSHAESKVMILLTDGEPTENDASPEVAIAAAKELGIKVYTIGIGGDITIYHPFYGRIQQSAHANTTLLKRIAKETGGMYFEAKKPDDMHAIYDTIDQLEKTNIEAPIFTYYHDWFMPFLWAAIALMIFEIVMSSLVWFSV